jgi:hypothetical protein
MILHVGQIDLVPAEDPRDRRIEMLVRMLAEAQAQTAMLIKQMKALDTSDRVALLVQIDLLTGDLVETQRQLRVARGRA